MKKLMIGAMLVLGLAVAGCTTTASPQLIARELVVVIPPEEFRNCPVLRNFPNPDTLTDAQVANILVQLDRNAKVCKNSINAIYAYLERAQRTIK